MPAAHVEGRAGGGGRGRAAGGNQLLPQRGPRLGVPGAAACDVVTQLVQHIRQVGGAAAVKGGAWAQVRRRRGGACGVKRQEAEVGRLTSCARAEELFEDSMHRRPSTCLVSLS